MEKIKNGVLIHTHWFLNNSFNEFLHFISDSQAIYCPNGIGFYLAHYEIDDIYITIKDASHSFINGLYRLKLFHEL